MNKKNKILEFERRILGQTITFSIGRSSIRWYFIIGSAIGPVNGEDFSIGRIEEIFREEIEDSLIAVAKDILKEAKINQNKKSR
jgi:hypothetical protein